MTSPPAAVVARACERARESGCQKSRRGAVVYRPFSPLAPMIEGSGANRPAIGACDGSAECRRDCGKICVHAEQMALLRADGNTVGAEMVHVKVDNDGKLVPSGDPCCVECSKLMLAAHIVGVWLYQESGWRRWTAEEFHRATLQKLGLYAAP